MTAAAVLIAAVAQTGGHATAQGARVSVVGMVIVFIGLVVLTLILPLLRKIIERSDSRRASVESRLEPVQPAAPTEEEMAAVVSALNAHLHSLEQIEHVRLTLGLYDKPYRPWRLAGRAEVLLGRQALGGRPRNRSL